MNDKKGPAVAWICAVLVALLSLIVAASAARTVHAAPFGSNGRHTQGQASLRNALSLL